LESSWMVEHYIGMKYKLAFECLVSIPSALAHILNSRSHSFSSILLRFRKHSCTMPEHRQRRDELFDISGVRGDFPQFFLLKGAEEPQFLGQFDDMEACNEHSNQPASSLKEDDLTWDKIMGTTKTYNNKGYSLDGGANDDDDSIGSGGGGGIYGELDDDDDGGGGNIYADL